MRHLLCNLFAVAMRSEPSHRAEMVNQLLQGDTAALVEERGEWVMVECDYDGYQGWVDAKQLSPIGEEEWRSLLQAQEGLRAQKRKSAESAAQAAVDYAVGLLDAPYLWGGRTRMGIDCSGLTQTAYKSAGVRLLRDASQQIGQGTEVPGIEQAEAGDLCFFQNDEGRIVHVGLAMGGGRIIHASGQVRIDRLDATGIYNEQRQTYTHRLHSIRRITQLDQRD